MRKIWLISLIMVLAVGYAGADRLTYDQTKTQMALKIATPPTIDGFMDLDNNESWVTAGGADQSKSSTWFIQVDANVEGGIRGGTISDPNAIPVDNAEFSYKVWVGFDDTNLYVGVRVSDNTPNNPTAAANSANGNTWQDDSVEVFVDGDNSNFATRDTTGSNPEVVGSGGQFVITRNNAYREAEAGNPGYGASKAWYAVAAPNADDTGYDAEFRISLKTLGNPKRGEVIGFTVAVNDNYDGSATRQIIWCGETHVEASYGNLALGTRAYTAVKVTAAPTVDGKIDAKEYASAKEIKMNNHTGIFDLQSGNDTFPEGDHDYSAWVLYTNDAIYVAVDVTDNAVVTDTAEAGTEGGNTWEDDSAEIFFDGDLDKNNGAGSYTYEGQYVITPNGAVRSTEASSPALNVDWFAGAAITSKGYSLEYKIPIANLNNPDGDASKYIKQGSVVGFNMCVNDDDGAGRKAQLMWQGRAHNEASYGELTFGSTATPVNEWSLF